MSEVANKDLSTELYELSGWLPTQWWKMAYPSQTYQFEPYVVSFDTPEPPNEARWGYQFLPAYDLGYLLRKLPKMVVNTRLRLTPYSPHEWQCGYAKFAWSFGHSPEDTACKLAIELFKQGVLKKESK